MSPKASYCSKLDKVSDRLESSRLKAPSHLRLVSNQTFNPIDTCSTKNRLKKTEAVFMEALLLSMQTGKPLFLEQSESADAREWLGIVCEGSALGLALLDHVTPWNRNRWLSFTEKEGARHIHVAYIALGIAQAYLKQPVLERLENLDSIWKWLVVDGFGFHHGYNQSHNFLYCRGTLKGLNSPAAIKAFHQGLGRSLWFVENGRIEKIAKIISLHKKARRQDLWTGVGVAAAYAGGATNEALALLTSAAGTFSPALCQGVAFASMVRSQSESQAAHTERACQIICRLSAEECAAVAEEALNDLPKTDEAYEIWRQRIRDFFAK